MDWVWEFGNPIQSSQKLRVGQRVVLLVEFVIRYSVHEMVASHEAQPS